MFLWFYCIVIGTRRTGLVQASSPRSRMDIKGSSPNNPLASDKLILEPSNPQTLYRVQLRLVHNHDSRDIMSNSGFYASKSWSGLLSRNRKLMQLSNKPLNVSALLPFLPSFLLFLIPLQFPSFPSLSSLLSYLPSFFHFPFLPTLPSSLSLSLPCIYIQGLSRRYPAM